MGLRKLLPDTDEFFTSLAAVMCSVGPVFNAGSFPPPGAYDPGAVALAPPVSPPVSQPVPLAPLAPLAPRPVRGRGKPAGVKVDLVGIERWVGGVRG